MSAYEELCELLDDYEEAYAANHMMELLSLAAQIRIQASLLLGESVEMSCKATADQMRLSLQ